ncbi:MAG: ribose 5-phosphate isomerase B [Rhodospirillaceae bacterium]|nr:ribose 5-phosphate isomerase B [Rhodospirillaceae bacterium]|tara:strand:- start:84 stop:536 length:453 start_codon:yes stop_codon:yes gene_type:complete
MDSGTKETIAIASDHAGFDLKSDLAEYMEDSGYQILDLGTNGPDSVDYPDFAHALADALEQGKTIKGVLVCGSGIGISIAANRHEGVRAALIHDALGARMCRQHNNANVIVFGGRMIGPETAKDCLGIFLNTEFEGGRHARRLEKLALPQ